MNRRRWFTKQRDYEQENTLYLPVVRCFSGFQSLWLFNSFCRPEKLWYPHRQIQWVARDLLQYNLPLRPILVTMLSLNLLWNQVSLICLKKLMIILMAGEMHGWLSLAHGALWYLPWGCSTPLEFFRRGSGSINWPNIQNSILGGYSVCMASFCTSLVRRLVSGSINQHESQINSIHRTCIWRTRRPIGNYTWIGRCGRCYHDTQLLWGYVTITFTLAEILILIAYYRVLSISPFVWGVRWAICFVSIHTRNRNNRSLVLEKACFSYRDCMYCGWNWWNRFPTDYPLHCSNYRLPMGNPHCWIYMSCSRLFRVCSLA